MRRRLTLYIGGESADLADDALVLMNYALTDLTNPAAIRNSYTHDVDLPRTDRNSRIFGSSFRLDRNAGAGDAGAAFNASRRVPFAIFAETGQILTSGYCKLNAVTADAYNVSLYGGLGDFIYGLTADADGNQLTLADLDFGVDLDFTVNAATVAEAWARLGGDATKPAKWDVINFAPAYNGIPSDFEAGTAVAQPADVGLDVPAGMNTRDGYCVVNLIADVDEWDAHDLRSYLQRPVVSLRKIIEAIADPANNGGWTVDLSDIDRVPYLDTWLTRPLIPSLGSFKQVAGDVAIEPVTPSVVTSGNVIGAYLLSDVGDATVEISLSFRPAFRFPGVSVYELDARDGSALQLTFVQAVGYDADGNMVEAGEAIAVVYSSTAVDIDALAAACGYTPKMGAGIRIEEEDFYAPTGTPDIYARYQELETSLSGAGIVRVEVECYVYRIDAITKTVLPGGGGIQAVMTGGATEYTSTGATIVDPTGTATSSSGHPLRTGALITQRMLLSTAGTPADYLVALCKLAGLALVADAEAKTVNVLRRASLYNGPTIDLTPRVDRTKGVEITPITFDRKWYEWKVPSVGGRFAAQYRETTGQEYGIQRVDTGYEFDAGAKDVLQGIALKSAAAVCDRSRYWYLVTEGGDVRPSLFVAPGTTYTLWDNAGNSEDYGVSTPSASAVLTPYDGRHPGYDPDSRAEFRDADDKALDGADVLLFHAGIRHLDGFALSDDNPVMEALADGPCWLLGSNAAGLDVPQFTRYTMADGAPAWLLDMGYPREIDIPGIDYGAGTTVYAAAWAQYVRDRLSVHCKVLKARVDLTGLPDGPDLLRSFYWYGGSLWVLSSIRNHSLTTFDPAECEFVQVRDTTAYTGGQTF